MIAHFKIASALSRNSEKYLAREMLVYTRN